MLRPTPRRIDRARLEAGARGSTGSPRAEDARWDVLLVCVAGYILTAVGRVHQLFPALEVLHPAIVAGLFAVALYLIDRRAVRRAGLLWVDTTLWLLALLVWMTLSIPGALNRGVGFDMAGEFVKTTLMYLIIVAAVRGWRDVERLTAIYFAAAAIYAAAVLTRFDLSEGSQWRLGKLYYYDANDF